LGLHVPLNLDKRIMNPYIKEEWVKELRSGNFIQTTGSLRGKKNERCALGVLVDVFIKYHPRVAGWAIGEVSQWDLVVHNGLGGFEKHELSGVLAKVVSEWAGLEEDVNPEVEVYDQVDDVSNYYHISECNDDVGMSFDEIAEAIERDL
jgi:hypothetical protein